MSWHVSHKQTIQYDTGVVKVGDVLLSPYRSDELNDSRPVENTSLRIRKCRILMKKAFGKFEFFQTVRKNNDFVQVGPMDRLRLPSIIHRIVLNQFENYHVPGKIEALFLLRVV